MNNLREEKMQILKMIEDGKINSKDGIELLSALEEKENLPMPKSSKWLRIKVFDPEDNTKVNVNVPIALIDVGLKFATKVSPELKNSDLNGIDFNEIVEMIKSGAEGKIVDVESGDGERVEIVVE
ncbi:hypothetical protein SAMN05660462_02964 [Proteiniborus ethanoligenes]|uniref:YvlB/LiaX N-terminal domain-containing protein n=1 Tax=Proteiniborus ethanoligenes TaxID=415015 RepID=A0A1H3SLN2_9FIRM|nr:hypothetical protein [Proteiniborus ethanoligenes]SDZ38451.1 hypothetical protein SAMN05660462_02964 [Proteiniborus ethanoligenes]